MEDASKKVRLQPGAPVSEVFLLKDKTLSVAKNGKKYMTLILGDKSGDYEGKLWDEADLVDEQVGRMTPVHIEGVTSVYKEKLQITVRTIRPLEWDDSYFERLLPVSRFSLAELTADLNGLLDSLRNPHLRSLAGIIRADSNLMARFTSVPAAKKIHHAYIRGLMEHTVSMMKVSAFLADHYELQFPGRVDRDVLLMGTFLHDIGKTREYDYRLGIDFTQEGRLLGHLVLGVEILNSAAAKLPRFPADLLERVKHLIISHHGELEKGAPVAPLTFEGQILHLVDYLDSQANAVGRLIEGSGEKEWTEFSNKFERRFLASRLSPAALDSASADDAPTPDLSSAPDPVVTEVEVPDDTATPEQTPAPEPFVTAVEIPDEVELPVEPESVPRGDAEGGGISRQDDPLPLPESTPAEGGGKKKGRRGSDRKRGPGLPGLV